MTIRKQTFLAIAKQIFVSEVGSFVELRQRLRDTLRVRTGWEV